MPTAPDELRDLAEKLFGDLDTVGPIRFLHSRGYKDTKGGEWIPPTPDHKPTRKEEICLDFLFMEWDFGGFVQPERQEQSSGGVEPIEAEAARILRQAYGRLVTPDDDGSFYAVIREFPGCIATSDTASEALANLESVAESWLLAELDRGHNIPGPTPFEWPRGASRAAYALRPISGPDTRAALVEAREALGPFAAKAENYDGTWENIDGLDLPYEDDHDIGINVEVGNVRHARSALASIDRVLSSPPTAEPLAEETTVLWRKRHGCSEPRIATSRERNRDVGGAP